METLADSHLQPYSQPQAKNQIQDTDKFAFLEPLTSSKWHHGKKSLYEHLCNVHSILQSQSASTDLANAGLFHAIYGTAFFSFSSSVVNRDVVRGYIGDYAEQLVYIFCSLGKGRLNAIVTNAGGWSSGVHLDLVRLELANALDHTELGSHVDERVAFLDGVVKLLESGPPGRK